MTFKCPLIDCVTQCKSKSTLYRHVKEKHPDFKSGDKLTLQANQNETSNKLQEVSIQLETSQAIATNMKQENDLLINKVHLLEAELKVLNKHLNSGKSNGKIEHLITDFIRDYVVKDDSATMSTVKLFEEFENWLQNQQLYKHYQEDVDRHQFVSHVSRMWGSPGSKQKWIGIRLKNVEDESKTSLLLSNDICNAMIVHQLYDKQFCATFSSDSGVYFVIPSTAKFTDESIGVPIKFGSSRNVEDRLKQHSSRYGSLIAIGYVKHMNPQFVESELKQWISQRFRSQNPKVELAGQQFCDTEIVFVQNNQELRLLIQQAKEIAEVYDQQLSKAEVVDLDDLPEISIDNNILYTMIRDLQASNSTADDLMQIFARFLLNNLMEKNIFISFVDPNFRLYRKNQYWESTNLSIYWKKIKAAYVDMTEEHSNIECGLLNNVRNSHLNSDLKDILSKNIYSTCQVERILLDFKM